MSRPSSTIPVEVYLERLGRAIAREECWTCDCLQGLLTQIELDCPQAGEETASLKVPRHEMHGCLGCDPCPPAALFAEYLRRQNESQESEARKGGKEKDMNSESKTDRRDAVREEYGKIARGGASCCGPTAKSSSCCGSAATPESVARAVGYGAEEVAGLPEGANMGLSCGNPTALASLRPGETVLDLGSGGGFDAFIAARKVGPGGRVIGVDMTADMVGKARRNAEAFRESSGLDNVEFRLGEIEHLPVADASVDVVISNCVINLSPDKPQVWREIARVLKPGGRVAVSDLALLRPLPDTVRESVTALVGCVGGAALVDETREMIRAAGLTVISLERKPGYIDTMTEWSDPLYREIAAKLAPGAKPGDYVTSLDIAARRPASPDSEEPAQASSPSQGQGPPQCGPECNCAPAGLSTRAKMFICFLVALAGAAVLARGFARKSAENAAGGQTGFAVAMAAAPSEASTVTAGKVGETDQPRPSLWGESLSDLASLNRMAAEKDAVFVYLPDSGRDPDDNVRHQIEVAAANLQSAGNKTAFFVLDTGSQDYARVTSQVPAPCVLAMVKGRGMSAVVNDFSEKNLLQAIVAASRPSACGPSSCGPSACGPSGCN